MLRAKHRGFTLIELLVVISIISLLSSLVLVGLRKAQDKAEEAVAKANVNQATKALEMYYADHGYYPSGTFSSDEGWDENFANTLTPNYIPELPTDAKGKFTYTYDSDGSDYEFDYDRTDDEEPPPEEDPLIAWATPGTQGFNDTLTTTLESNQEGAYIYYTLDGSTPMTLSGTLYDENPIILTQTTTLKFFAWYDDSYSNTYTETYAKTEVEPPYALIEVNGPDWLETRAPYKEALTNYYAPHAVFFEGWKSGPDRENIASYSWNFGDGNTFSGFNAAHVYETPGVYTATLTVTDAQGRTASDSIQITVRARDGDTYYVDSSLGDDSYSGLCKTPDGSGCGPWKTATKAFTEISGSTPLYSPGDQILFKRDQTFDAATDPDDGFGAYRISLNAYGIMFGAYGEGNKPVIQAVGDGGGSLLANAFAARRFNSFVDLEFNLTPPDGDPTSIFSAAGGGANYLWLRVDIKDFFQGWGLNPLVSNAFSGFFLVGCTAYKSEVVHFYCIATRVALLNNTFEYSGNHIAYAELIDKGVIHGNDFNRPAFGRTALRISGNDLEHMASNVWVSNNSFQGWVDPRTDGRQYASGVEYNFCLVEFAPNTGDPRFGEWLVFENNIVSNAQIFMRLGGWEHVKIRNNYFTTPDPSQANKLHIGHDWELRPLYDIRIVDNIFEYTGTVLPGFNTMMIRLDSYIGPEYEGRTTHENIIILGNIFLTSDTNFRFIQIPFNSSEYESLDSENNLIYCEDNTSSMFAQRSGDVVPFYYTLPEWRSLTNNDLATQIYEDSDKPVPGWTTSSMVNNTSILVTYKKATPMKAELGTAQGGGADNITLTTSASSVNNYYNDKLLKIISGTGAGQAQVIKDYDGSTKKATFYLPWTTVNHLSWVVPDNTSVYEIIGQATISEVALWVKYEDNEWQDTGLRSSGTSGSFSYTPDQGSGTYYFATQAFDSQGNSSLPPVGPGSSQIQYISSVTSNLSESYLTNLFQQTLANPFMILSEGLK